MINKFYYYCQIKGEALQHFKFTLKKDFDFNYKIIVDIMYLNKNLYIIQLTPTLFFKQADFKIKYQLKKNKKLYMKVGLIFILAFQIVLLMM